MFYLKSNIAFDVFFGMAENITMYFEYSLCLHIFTMYRVLCLGEPELQSLCALHMSSELSVLQKSLVNVFHVVSRSTIYERFYTKCSDEF